MINLKPHFIKYLFAIVPLFLICSLSQAFTCSDLFLNKKTQNFSNLSFEFPEIEAKFKIYGAKTITQIKKLEGTQIQLTDAHGTAHNYTFSFNKIHIYEDTNFDTKDLQLLQSRGMLRQRVRYDWSFKKGKYKFNKAVFQSKDAPHQTALNSSIFAREEIRGNEYKSLKKFLKKFDKNIGKKSKDKAVEFAQELLNLPKKFKPVLFISDERYFLRLAPDSNDNALPSFYISIDTITFNGLLAQKKSAQALELEIELDGDLTSQTSESLTYNAQLLNDLTNQLQSRFNLEPSLESKYETGMRLTNQHPDKK